MTRRPFFDESPNQLDRVAFGGGVRRFPNRIDWCADLGHAPSDRQRDSSAPFGNAQRRHVGQHGFSRSHRAGADWIFGAHRHAAAHSGHAH